MFDGLKNEKKLKDVTFFIKNTTNRNLNKIRRSIDFTIDKEEYCWNIARVTIDGKGKLE